MERLQKVIANYGYCSRRKAEELISEGKVLVNGNVITSLGTKVSKEDTIVVEGVTISKEVNYVYYLLNKPRGVVTTSSDDKGRKTVIDLIDTPIRIYPVGRLDYDTTGLILLTNDGEFTNNITHPKNKIDKTYVAKINGILAIADIMALKKGVMIDNFKTSPAKVKVRKIDNKNKHSIVEITIHEGKNHQVKRMFESLGYEVLKLKRERIAFLTLKGLTSGDYRMLTPKEVNQLYVLSQNVGK